MYTREELISKIKYKEAPGGCHETNLKNNRIPIETAPSILLDTKYEKATDRKVRSRRKTFRKSLIRLVYELYRGEIPGDMEVFSCNDKCINPDHLILKSRKERGKENRKEFPRIYSDESLLKLMNSKKIIDLTVMYNGTPCWQMPESSRKKESGGYTSITTVEYEPVIEIDEKGKEVERRRHKSEMTHRVMYRIMKGELDPKLEVDHLCGVRHCINPDHLEQVTKKVNRERSNLPNVLESMKGKRKRITCNKGHLVAGDNISLEGGYQRCLECRKEHNRKQREKRKLMLQKLELSDTINTNSGGESQGEI